MVHGLFKDGKDLINVVVELDRKLEALVCPVVHMLRQALQHGLQRIEARLRKLVLLGFAVIRVELCEAYHYRADRLDGV